MSEQNFLTDERARFYSQQFSDVFQMLPQEKGGKLRQHVTVQSGIVGEGAVAANQIGETEVNEVKTKYEDSPQNEIETARRWYYPRTSDWGTLFEQADKIRTLGDPNNMYALAAKKAFGRKEDNIILEAFYGGARVGKSGEEEIGFNDENIIRSASAGLTVEKLINAWELLAENDVDMETETPIIVITPKQAANLLKDAKYSNGDYGKPVLDDGKLKHFLGFDFVLKNVLPTNENNERLCAVFVKSAMGLGIWDDLTIKMSERDDKKYLPYLYMRQSIGATRLNEKGCAIIECVEQ